jgi:hypothetical protein
VFQVEWGAGDSSEGRATRAAIDESCKTIEDWRVARVPIMEQSWRGRVSL